MGAFGKGDFFELLAYFFRREEVCKQDLIGKNMIVVVFVNTDGCCC